LVGFGTILCEGGATIKTWTNHLQKKNWFGNDDGERKATGKGKKQSYITLDGGSGWVTGLIGAWRFPTGGGLWVRRREGS